jgi:hypothetical protein
LSCSQCKVNYILDFKFQVYILFNKIRGKGKIASAWKRGGGRGEGGGEVVKGGGRGKGREMTQALYVHMNKILKNFKF